MGSEPTTSFREEGAWNIDWFRRWPPPSPLKERGFPLGFEWGSSVARKHRGDPRKKPPLPLARVQKLSQPLARRPPEDGLVERVPPGIAPVQRPKAVEAP